MSGLAESPPWPPLPLIDQLPAHGSLNRPNLVSVGVIVWLSSELMFFAALFAMYFTVRAVNEPNWPPKDVVLDLKTAAPFTIILVLSSVTCQLGVFAAERGDVDRLRFWFMVTFFMGSVFIGGQSFEYFVHNDFILDDQRLRLGLLPHHRLPRAARLGGLIAFVLLLIRTTFGKFSARAGDRCDRRVVLLALRRHRLDRPVHRHLPDPLAEWSL